MKEILLVDDSMHCAEAVKRVVADRSNLSVVHFFDFRQAMAGINKAFETVEDPFRRAVVAPLDLRRSGDRSEGEDIIMELLSRRVSPEAIALLSGRDGMDRVAAKLGVVFIDRSRDPEILFDFLLTNQETT